MKSFLLNVLIILSALLFSYTALHAEPGRCSRITAETISKHVPVSDFKIVSSREVQGVCEVVIIVNNRIIPLYGDEKGFISGDLFNEKQNITRKMVYDLNKKLFLENRGALDEVTAIEYKPAEIKSEKILYMFTEPLCPYCHKAGSEVKKLADKYGIRVKILLVSMKGDEGKRKCIEAACRRMIFKEKFSLEEYNQIEWKKEKAPDEYICDAGINMINKTEELSNRMCIDGIPLFYMDNGEYVSGADIEAMELLMSSK